jgi:mono/diheme cytochrome c family protein
VAVASEPSNRVDFLAHVQPIFAARCVECHGAAKTKGDLRLDQPLDEGLTGRGRRLIGPQTYARR